MRITVPILCLCLCGCASGLSDSHAIDLDVLKTNLEARVGGTWQIQTNQEVRFVSPLKLPGGLVGTYCIFSAVTNRTALEQATNWMATCQAPFFILGTNAECVAVTYIPRSNTVSRAVVEALQLCEPSRVSPTEAMLLRRH